MSPPAELRSRPERHLAARVGRPQPSEIDPNLMGRGAQDVDVLVEEAPQALESRGVTAQDVDGTATAAAVADRRCGHRWVDTEIARDARGIGGQLEVRGEQRVVDQLHRLPRAQW